MKVYGCTDDLMLAPQRFTVDQIVELNIDPWRLDLMDPNPVMVGERRFRRLSDVAFAYRDKESRICVGLHDGELGSCSIARQISWEDKTLHLSDFAPSGRSFTDHFREYLMQMEQASPHRETNVFPAPPAPAASLEFGVLEWTLGRNPYDVLYEPVYYVGEMLDERELHADLPDEINWVFDEFADRQPFVSGVALRRALRKFPVRQVLVAVPKKFIEDARRKYLSFRTRMECPECEIIFREHGCEYKVVAAETAVCYLSEWSCDHFRSFGKNRVVGKRIAWSDLGCNLARPLAHFGCFHPECTVYKSAQEELTPEKLTILEAPSWR